MYLYNLMLYTLTDYFNFFKALTNEILLSKV